MWLQSIGGSAILLGVSPYSLLFVCLFALKRLATGYCLLCHFVLIRSRDAATFAASAALRTAQVQGIAVLKDRMMFDDRLYVQ